MSTNDRVHNASEDEARELAESSRDTSWAGKSFMKELFLGNLRIDWIDPFPVTPRSDEFQAFYNELREFMENEVDSELIDATGEYPPHVIPGLKKLGVFGMKIPKKYGGKGFTQAEYCQALEMMAYYEGSLIALVSAHQSIGVPTPVYLFGTEAQKAEYLPRCAAGAITAFALTEPDVGSDPARLATIATRTEDGDFILNGKKLWITNGTIAELMVVMARHDDTGKISAFIVECSDPGVTVDYRCRFMGLKAIANGVIGFDSVRVPKENLIHAEGSGLKVALTTLNTGRLSLPAACLGANRNALAISRDFASRRVQWGAPVGKHEAVSHKLADMASLSFAMESLSHLANELSMRDGYDIRLEAAADKEYVSTRNYKLLDECLQIRGGRGYETEASLRGRGEKPYPVERMLRDSRINRIFEGSSEIMHLFMAREALDKHLSVAWDFINAKNPLGKRLATLPSIAFFYAFWYPKLWLGGLTNVFKYRRFGQLGGHLRYAERATRRLARNVFHGMVWYQAGLEKKKAFLFRAVDIAMEILVLSATITRTQRMLDERHADAESASKLADLHGWNTRHEIERLFRDLWTNADAQKYAMGVAVLEGEQRWVEADTPMADLEPDAPAVAAAAK